MQFNSLVDYNFSPQINLDTTLRTREEGNSTLEASDTRLIPGGGALGLEAFSRSFGFGIATKSSNKTNYP